MLKKMKLGVLTAAILASSVVYAVEPMTDVSKTASVKNDVKNDAVNKESVFKRVDIKATQVKLVLNDYYLNTFKLFDNIQADLDSGTTLEDAVKKYGEMKSYKVNDVSTVFGVRASFRQKDYLPYISDIVKTDDKKEGLKSGQKVKSLLEIGNIISFMPYLYENGSVGLKYTVQNEQLINMEKIEIHKDIFVDSPHTNMNSVDSTIVVKNNKDRLVALSQDASANTDSKNDKKGLNLLVISVNYE